MNELEHKMCQLQLTQQLCMKKIKSKFL